MLGLVGVLLSVPLTVFVKIVLESFEDTRWIARLLARQKVWMRAKREGDEIKEERRKKRKNKKHGNTLKLCRPKRAG